MQRKSLSINAVLNMFKTVVGVLFPLITFPYISRVLGVENIGKNNFATSIVSYFSLISSFGIYNYAVREGAKVRENKTALDDLTSEIFSFNIITTTIAYVLLAGFVLVSGIIRSYALLIAIQSTTMIFTTIGIEWLCNVFEDYVYITVRTIMFQVLSLVLMFLLVKSENDYIVYAVICVFSVAGAQCLNYIRLRKQVNIRFKPSNCKRHLKPMTMFFLAGISSIIFLNSDQTMIGLINGDYNLGIYAVSVKVYTIVKNIIISVVAVIVPRMTQITEHGNSEEQKAFMTDVINGYLLLIVPMAVGLYVISDGAIWIVGGTEYIEAITSLKILSISLLAAAGSAFMVCLVVIPRGREKVLLCAPSVSAIVNVILNCFVVKRWAQNGAAFTTLVAELMTFSICYFAVKPEFDSKRIFKNSVSIAIASMGIYMVNHVVRLYVTDILWVTGFVIALSVIVYILLLCLTKNEYAEKVLQKVKCQLIK